MTDEQTIKLRELLVRAGVSDGLAEGIAEDAICDAMDIVTEVFGEREAPDESWWQDYYLVTGEHMVLTAEGWCPGGCVDDSAVLLELNAEQADSFPDPPSCTAGDGSAEAS